MEHGMTRFVVVFGLILSCAGYAGAAVGQIQSVTGLFSPSSLSSDQPANLTLSYSVTGNRLLPGLGLRIHFNSADLTAGDPQQLLPAELQGFQLQNDLEDYDAEPSTDKYLLIAWADLAGAGWPQQTGMPAQLAVLPFTTLSGFSGTQVNFTASSLPYGYSLEAQSAVLELAPERLAAPVDSDGDGLPDSYEIEHGLNPNDPTDAESDLDGDGASNIDEYIVGSDPTLDELPPELVIPQDVTVAATGHLTAVDIGQATATDDSGIDLLPSANSVGPFVSGLHEILWSVADAAGNTASQIQHLRILPLAELTPSVIVTEGTVHEVTVILSGKAPAYPVTIPLIIEGSADAEDFSLSDLQVVIEQGTVGKASLTIERDRWVEPDETIVIRLGEPENAVLGVTSEGTVTITEENIAPTLTLTVEQDGRQGRLVTADGGLIRVKARYSDLNLEDSHWFEWAPEIHDLPIVKITKNTFALDPAQITAKGIIISASVRDNGSPMLSTMQKIVLEVLPSAPVLAVNDDSDGDGIVDVEEGFGDADDDGIPDYLDNLNNREDRYLSEVTPTGNVFLQTEVGTEIQLGEATFEMGNNSVALTEEQTENLVCDPDQTYQYSSGLFDFSVTGKQSGSSYDVIIPLAEAIPQQAVYRTCVDTNIGWQNFIVNAYNWVASAKAVKGACPEPGSALYSRGLTPGDNCLEIHIEDGGPDDLDGRADGTVTDPSGIAVMLAETTSEPPTMATRGQTTSPAAVPPADKPSSGGGCTIGDGKSPDSSLALLALFGLLRLCKRKTSPKQKPSVYLPLRSG